MMTNRSRIVLYTGITNGLERRIWFHRNNTIKSFTKTYKVDRLVYYEQFNEARYAIAREKEIKGWRREKKNELVRTLNPQWRDLSVELFDPERERPRDVINAVDPLRKIEGHLFDCEVPRSPRRPRDDRAFFDA